MNPAEHFKRNHTWTVLGWWCTPCFPKHVFSFFRFFGWGFFEMFQTFYFNLHWKTRKTGKKMRKVGFPDGFPVWLTFSKQPFPCRRVYGFSVALQFPQAVARISSFAELNAGGCQWVVHCLAVRNFWVEKLGKHETNTGWNGMIDVIHRALNWRQPSCPPTSKQHT